MSNPTSLGFGLYQRRIQRIFAHQVISLCLRGDFIESYVILDFNEEDGDLSFTGNVIDREVHNGLHSQLHRTYNTCCSSSSLPVNRFCDALELGDT